ncbi:MAG: VRR-NUC domain-containing protein [Christensenellaceae bacterium]
MDLILTEKEHKLQNKIINALSVRGMVFRTNAGDFWQGKIACVPRIGKVVAFPRRVVGLPKGFSDLLFIDERGAAFIEVKAAGGRASKEQINFLRAVKAKNQRAGIAYSVQDALDIIENRRTI